MDKRWLMFGFVLILLSSFVSAEIVFNDTFDRANSNTVGNGWIEASEGAVGDVAISSNTMKLYRSSTVAQAYHTWTSSYTPSDDFEICLKYKQDSNSKDGIINIFDDTEVQPPIYMKFRTTGNIEVFGNNPLSYTSVQAFSANTYYVVCFYPHSANEYNISIDGVNKGTYPTYLNQNFNDIEKLDFRSYDAALLVNIDWVNVTNSSVTIVHDFKLSLIDALGNSLTNFTANFTNSTGTTTLNTTNGTIFYPIDQIVNISIYDIINDGWTYQNVTNNSINTSAGNLEAVTDIFDNSAPTITLNPSNGFNAANFSLENQYDDNISLNITFADNRDLYGFLINFTRSGTSYFNFTNYTLSGTSYNYIETINTSTWPAGTYDIEIQAYDSKTLNRTDPSTEIHNTVTQYNSWYRGNYTKNEPLLFELEYGTLAISLTDDTTIFNISADLYFNDTLIINSTSVDVGSTWKINNTIGGYTTGVYNYSWVIEITQADGNKSEANITGEIEIFAFGIDDCSSYNYTTLYINIFDENTPSAALNATVEIDAEIWISSPSNSRQFYQLLEGNSTYRFCLLNPNAEFFTDMYMKYTTDDGFTHRYYLVNESLTNVTKNVSMYNFNTTTDISDMKITVRDYDTYQYLPNIITKLQRRYPAEGVWRTVQMDESGDFGLVFFNIKEENTDYRLLFYDRSNNLLKTTEKMKFICDSGVCQLTFTISPYSQIMIAEPVEVIANYDNSTKILTVTWTDPDAGTRSVRTLVTKETITGTVDICDQTQSGAAGTVVCNVSAYSGDILLSVITDNMAADSQWINIARQKLGTVLNVLEASVWTFAIMVTVAMFGVFIGAVATVIATIIGLIIVYYIGLFNPITLTFIIIASAVGIAIGIKLRN